MAFIREIKTKSGTYLAEVKSVRENGKVKQQFLRYIGKKVEGKTVRTIRTDNIEVETVKRSLDVLLVDQIAQELSLNSIKDKNILVLLYSQLLEKRSINKLDEWLQETEIPKTLQVETSTKKLYEALTSVSDLDFSAIEEQVYSHLEKYEKQKTGAIIDVTDTYFEGCELESQTRRGKDEKVKPLLQIGLAVSLEHGFPILHKTYHGNLSNIQIFKDMVFRLRARKLKSVVLDRGMTSPENLELIEKLGLQVIAGVKKSGKLVQDVVLKTDRAEIYSLKNRVKLKKSAVFAKAYEFFKGKLVVVYNPSLEVIKNELDFEKGEEINAQSGYSLIYHNTGLSTEDVVKKYFEKDVVERAFKQLKGVLNLRPVRVWLKDHVEGHVKICYLAYPILSLINYRLRKLGISASDALDSLKYGYNVSFTDKKTKTRWNQIVPLRPKQKIILKALKVVYKN